MERVNKILNHPLWKESLEKIKELEQDRIFCRHNTQHFLDVARLAWIENLERDLGISKEWIYAAAMLHDIGRHLEYLDGLSHEKGSALLAETILKDCGFTKEEQTCILSAILQHRTKEISLEDSLSGVIYRGDKQSRACLFCEAQEACNWSHKKKNLTLTI